MLGRKNHEKLTEREQVAKRREEVLSRGRKFKYPLQYAKHRVAIIATIIAIVAVLALGLISYAALYVFGSTNEVLYRGTEFIPIPVAEIAGEKVRFFDYLLLYRSSIAIVNSDDKNFATTSAEYKRSSLSSAEKYTYAIKLARELDVHVSDEEVEALFNEHRRVGGTERSEQSFLKILSDNFGLSKSEYIHLLRLLLIKMKVAATLDETARTNLEKAEQLLKSNTDLSAVAKSLGEEVEYEDTDGLLDPDNVDGGRSTIASSMEVGQISEPFISTSGDGYYIVKLLEKTDGEISYASLKFPFTVFDDRFSELIEKGDYAEYITITIPASDTPTEDSDE